MNEVTFVMLHISDVGKWLLQIVVWRPGYLDTTVKRLNGCRTHNQRVTESCREVSPRHHKTIVLSRLTVPSCTHPTHVVRVSRDVLSLPFKHHACDERPARLTYMPWENPNRCWKVSPWVIEAEYRVDGPSSYIERTTQGQVSLRSRESAA